MRIDLIHDCCHSHYNSIRIFEASAGPTNTFQSHSHMANLATRKTISVIATICDHVDKKQNICRPNCNFSHFQLTCVRNVFYLTMRLHYCQDSFIPIGMSSLWNILIQILCSTICTTHLHKIVYLLCVCYLGCFTFRLLVAKISLYAHTHSIAHTHTHKW